MSEVAVARPLPPAPPPCWRCRAVLALVLLAVVASFAYLAVDYRGLFTAQSLRDMARFVAEFFPPDLSAPFVSRVGWGMLQTLAVSALGTLLAALGGALLALPASGRAGAVARQAARFGLNVLRSVPELVWAALMVLAAGIGPFAGALALALHTTGVLGRLFAESLENAPRGPERALTLSGAGTVAAFGYASLPIVLPQWIAYTLYRWEMNIRMAAVLGFVGGGGLGQLLYFHLSIFQQSQAMTVLAAMFALVALVDAVSARLRRGLGHVHA
jgi:phosphonate transport system permease protein